MRRPTTLAAILVLLTLPQLADALTGDLLRSIPTPGAAPTGLAFDGRYLWVADRIDDTLAAVDPATGAVVRSLPAPGFVPLGLAWDGEHLWCLDGEDRLIHELDPATGLSLTRFEAPSSSPQGLAWDGTYLWLSDDRADTISQISTVDGTTVVSFPSPSGSPQGMSFDGRYLWVADRMADEIHMVDPVGGEVLVTIDAPGPHARGLAWADGVLWNVDYQDDRIHAIAIEPGDHTPRSADAKSERLVLTHELRSYGPGEVESFDLYFAIPSDLPNQRLLGPVRFEPAPTDTVRDRWGQELAHFHLDHVPEAERIRHTMTVDVELRAATWFIFPDEVGSLDDIPQEIRDRYLVDEDKYRIGDPVIAKAVAEAVGDEIRPYWIMRRIHRYVGAKLEYELAGGWNVAPAVLERGTGSCSEYSFVFIAMCRAAGLPARYVGAVLLRGDDASTDEVFHRWPEVYLPGYGWVPADAQAGDKERPADVARSIGSLDARALITTSGGGNSEYLAWGYNTNEAWTSRGPAKTHVESVGEWSPLAADGD